MNDVHRLKSHFLNIRIEEQIISTGYFQATH